MSEKEVKQIIVSGAVILRENNGVKEIFVTQRGYGDWKGWWEILAFLFVIYARDK